jgi:hypothetical protein
MKRRRFQFPRVLGGGVGALEVIVIVAFGGTLLPLPVRAAAPAGRYAVGGGVVYDTKTKLSWQQVVPPGMYAQADAASYCAALELAGTTWRLPTMREILTIVDLTIPPPKPAIDPTAFPDTPAGFFWSSTAYSGTPGLGWSAQFQYGYAYGNTVTDTSYVRCVHTGRAATITP